MLEKYNRPVFFYSLALLIPWIMWLAAAYFSRLPESTEYFVLQGTLGIMGLIAPVAVAAYLFLSNKGLAADLKGRSFKLTGYNPVCWLFAVLLIFTSIVIAQLISVLLGYSIQQFYISGHLTFKSALFSPWFILIFAPVVEELAWHSYGTDALRRKFNLFTTSVIFAVYWTIWHLPLSFIKGYYHSNVVAEGWVYSLNFIVSLFVFVILMNWLYYKSNRNLLITIIFHLSANVSNEIFATHPMSKVIQTVLLLGVALIILVKEKSMFFDLHQKEIKSSFSSLQKKG